MRMRNVLRSTPRKPVTGTRYPAVLETVELDGNKLVLNWRILETRNPRESTETVSRKAVKKSASRVATDVPVAARTANKEAPLSRAKKDTVKPGSIVDRALKRKRLQAQTKKG